MGNLDVPKTLAVVSSDFMYDLQGGCQKMSKSSQIRNGQSVYNYCCFNVFNSFMTLCEFAPASPCTDMYLTVYNIQYAFVWTSVALGTSDLRELQPFPTTIYCFLVQVRVLLSL